MATGKRTNYRGGKSLDITDWPADSRDPIVALKDCVPQSWPERPAVENLERRMAAASAMLAALNMAAAGFAVIANNMPSNGEAAKVVALDNFKACKKALAQAEAAGIKAE